jgi:hypothetical protein
VKYEGDLEFSVTPDTIAKDGNCQNFPLNFQRKSCVYILSGDEFLAAYIEIPCFLHGLELFGRRNTKSS